MTYSLIFTKARLFNTLKALHLYGKIGPNGPIFD